MKISKDKYKTNQLLLLKSFLIIFHILFINVSLSFEVFINNPFYMKIYSKFISDNFLREENMNCDKYDPIYLMGERFKKVPISICNNNKSMHICYQTSKYNNYNKIARTKYGVICKSQNIILDPLKSRQTNYTYKGPVDKINKGRPILTKGFFNMKCKIKKNLRGYDSIYKNYFESWNYQYEKETEDIKELSPGKIILFISRNQDSPNIFHGLSEIINVLSIMYFFDLKPENIQIIFLESMKFQNDPFYILYKDMISRGGEPLYIRDMKEKYYIPSAIYVPVNLDSPLFVDLNIPRGYPDCKYSTQTYNILNKFINNYFNIPNFKDSFSSDNNIFYYPTPIINRFKNNTIFNKTITIQWRKVWPKGREFQDRILGNGPELANKLSLILPRNYLIRLVDTASLSLIEQISIMRKTDYFIGVHGAGLALSIFMPFQSILYEILPKKNCKHPILMSALSGHKVYSDILKSVHKIINNNKIYMFDINEFANNTLKHINDN